MISRTASGVWFTIVVLSFGLAACDADSNDADSLNADDESVSDAGGQSTSVVPMRPENSQASDAGATVPRDPSGMADAASGPNLGNDSSQEPAEPIDPQATPDDSSTPNGSIPGPGSLDASASSATTQTGGDDPSMATAADEDAGAPDPVGPLEPVTCSELSRTVMSGQCQTQSRCGANQLLTSCSLTGTDFWSCNCSDAETSLGFVLSGVDEQSACDVTADLCLHGTGPLESDAPECTPGDGSDPQYACQTTTTCTQTTQLSAGVSALTTDQLVAQCVDLGAGSYQCSCLNDAGGYSYVTHDVDAATACQSGMLLCDPYTPPTLPEPGDCEPTLEQRSGDECEWRHECVHTLALSNGVTIDVSELKYASCTTGPEGNLGCTCSDADRNLSFGLSSGEVGLPACEQAASLCETPSASKATDVVTCAPYTITSGADACTVRTQCSQPAIQNEVPIQLYGSLTAYCVTGTEALAEGQWNCSCDFSGVSQSMQLEVADAESGCRMAADACNGVDLAGPLSIIDSSSAVAR